MADETGKAKKAMDFINTTTVAFKNVLYFFGVVVGVVFFYFQVENHITDEEKHLSVEQVKTFDKDFQALRDRIEVLEWELDQIIILHARRHKNQQADIKTNKQALEDLEKALEDKMAAIRTEIFKYLFDESQLK